MFGDSFGSGEPRARNGTLDQASSQRFNALEWIWDNPSQDGFELATRNGITR